MNKSHWTDEQRIGRLYGLEAADDHIAECQPCRDRWESMVRRKVSLSAGSHVSEDFLAVQRRSILAKLHSPQLRLKFGTLPALAAVLLIFVAVMMFRPNARKESVEGVPDTQLYQDAFSIAASTSSSAVEPIQSLFEVEQ